MGRLPGSTAGGATASGVGTCWTVGAMMGDCVGKLVNTSGSAVKVGTIGSTLGEISPGRAVTNVGGISSVAGGRSVARSPIGENAAGVLLGAGTAVADGLAVDEALGVSDGLGVAEGVRVGPKVGSGVTVGRIVGRGDAVGAGLDVRVAVALEVTEGVTVALGVTDGVLLAVGEGDAVVVLLLVALGV